MMRLNDKNNTTTTTTENPHVVELDTDKTPLLPHPEDKTTHSAIIVAIGLGLPMLLGAAGLYCIIQGKVKEVRTFLFHAFLTC